MHYQSIIIELNVYIEYEKHVILSVHMGCTMISTISTTSTISTIYNLYHLATGLQFTYMHVEKLLLFYYIRLVAQSNRQFNNIGCNKYPKGLPKSY